MLAHFAFIVFVIAGGFLVLRWRRLSWLHVPAAAWGAANELSGWICPLTPLENWLRRAGGATPYEGSFVEHYLLPLIYPAGLTRSTQILLGFLVIGINVVAYGILWRRRSCASSETDP